jgi:hypothetical protein
MKDVEALAGADDTDFGALVRANLKQSHFSVTDTTRQTFTTIIPLDNTIPQSTEGTQILTSGVYTMRQSSNWLRIRAEATFSTGSGDEPVVLALFRSGTAGALRAAWASVAGNNYGKTIRLFYETIPNLSSLTLNLRAGIGVAGTIYLNGGATRFFGGVMRARMTIEEIGA